MHTAAVNLGGGMSDLQTEQEHLAEANRHIAEGEQRISEQLLLTEQLGWAGRDVSEAERLLLNLRQTLETWSDHRDPIVQEIARLESAPALLGLGA